MAINPENIALGIFKNWLDGIIPIETAAIEVRGLLKSSVKHVEPDGEIWWDGHPENHSTAIYNYADNHGISDLADSFLEKVAES